LSGNFLPLLGQTDPYESSGRPFTLDDVVAKFSGKGNSEYLLAFFDQKIEHLVNRGRKGNEIVVNNLCNSICYRGYFICSRKYSRKISACFSD